MLIPEKDQEIILMFAFRYALGRSSYAPSLIVELLKNAWKDLSKEMRQKIKDEIAEHYELFGFNKIDAESWLEILDWE